MMWRALFWFGVAAFCVGILGAEVGYDVGSWLWVAAFWVALVGWVVRCFEGVRTEWKRPS